MGEKRVKAYRCYVIGDVKDVPSTWAVNDTQNALTAKACAWACCWRARAGGRRARVVRIVAKPRESREEAYQRGRAEERADVVAWVRSYQPFPGYGLVWDVKNGVHLGAAKKGGGQ